MRHNLILLAPLCTTLRYNLTHLSEAVGGAPIRHMAQKLQMNVFGSILITNIKTISLIEIFGFPSVFQNKFLIHSFFKILNKCLFYI